VRHGATFVKRVTGLPGEIVQVDSTGSSKIGGKRLAKPYVPAASRLADTAHDVARAAGDLLRPG
jgi:hypothetical protein